MEKKNYITQISERDLEEISAACSPVAGFCIRIDKSQGQLKISVDESALRMAINGFVRNGGTATTAANAQSISFDPPS